MPVKLCIHLLCFLLLLADSCDSKSGNSPQAGATTNTSQTATQNTTPNPSVASANKEVTNEAQPAPVADASVTKPEFDACALIQTSEIESVQGDKVTATKGSNRAGGPFAVSQCFYTAANFVNSVSLEVNQRKPDDPNQNVVIEFWTKQFREAKIKRKSEKPQSVTGVGDEAYWVGSSKMGALYALKKDKFIRISIGGPATAEVKLQKTKKLAEYALKRL